MEIAMLYLAFVMRMIMTIRMNIDNYHPAGGLRESHLRAVDYIGVSWKHRIPNLQP
jgi:hypothetical protein